MSKKSCRSELMQKEKAVIRRSWLFAPVLVLVLLYVGIATAQQYPLMEKVAQKVIQKYQSSSCQELARQRAHPQRAQRAFPPGGTAHSRCSRSQS